MDKKIRVRYLLYLRSKPWAKIRGRLISKHGGCVECGCEFNLEVHHLTYERLFNERDEDLKLLCHTCHVRAHKKKSVKSKSKPASKIALSQLNDARWQVSKILSVNTNGMTWRDLAGAIDNNKAKIRSPGEARKTVLLFVSRKVSGTFIRRKKNDPGGKQQSRS